MINKTNNVETDMVQICYYVVIYKMLTIWYIVFL